jgi:hypothetical protein
MEEQPTTKAWYLSKMLWFNIIFGVLAVVFPKIREVFPENMFETAIAGVNIFLRFITKDKLIG